MWNVTFLIWESNDSWVTKWNASIQKKNQINSQIIFYVNEKTATQQEKKYSAPVT